MEQQWDVQSLMAAAARFPDLVADCPQRTYAILTKYEALRSFQATKPAAYTPLQYENAQIYTNTLLDSFVSYKALYKRLGEQIFGVQGKVLEIVPWSESEKGLIMTGSSPSQVMAAGPKDPKTGFYPFRETLYKFEASLKGLSDARTAVRRQMARIVNEVDLIERDPKLATDEDHTEPYQSPVAFEARIPTVQTPERLRVKSTPLTGRRIAAKELTEDQQKQILEDEEQQAGQGPLFMATDKLDDAEQNMFKTLLGETPTLSQHFRASSAVGDSSAGEMFNNLEFLKPDWKITWIRTEMFKGALVYLAVRYANGILVEKGAVSLSQGSGGIQCSRLIFPSPERSRELRILDLSFWESVSIRLQSSTAKNERRGRTLYRHKSSVSDSLPIAAARSLPELPKLRLARLVQSSVTALSTKT